MFATTSPTLASPLAPYFTYVSYDWIVHGKTTFATITEVRRTPEDNSAPASSRNVQRRNASEDGDPQADRRLGLPEH